MSNKTEMVFCEKAVRFFDKRREKKDTRQDALDAKEGIKESLALFEKVLYNIRKGYKDNATGVFHGPQNITIDEAVQRFFGADSLLDILLVLGISQNDQMKDVTAKLYGEQYKVFSNFEMFGLLESHTKLEYTAGTGNFGEYSFFLPELILRFVNNGYMMGGLHRRWIAATQDTGGSTTYVLPHVQRGRGFAKRVAEGASIPVSAMKLGQKRNKVKKMGTGTRFTDELFGEVSLMNMGNAMTDFGQIIALGEDIDAIKVLTNGDMTDGSESAPIVGVTDTAKGYQHIDLVRVFARAKRLGHNYNFIIAGENEGIALYTIPEMLGFGGETRLSRLNLNLALPASIEGDLFEIAEDQILLLDTTRCLQKVTNGGVRIERQREAETQTTVVYGSTQSDFAVLRRDARTILDRSVTFATNPFPTYMDIESYLDDAKASLS